MSRYYRNNEEQLIMLDEAQRQILKNFDDYPKLRNFVFRGGSGTGKTVMAIKCIKLLKERYERDWFWGDWGLRGWGLGLDNMREKLDDKRNIFVYAVTCQEEPEKSDCLPLLQDFQKDIASFLPRDNIRCGTLIELHQDLEDKSIGPINSTYMFMMTLMAAMHYGQGGYI